MAKPEAAPSDRAADARDRSWPTPSGGVPPHARHGGHRHARGPCTRRFGEGPRKYEHPNAPQRHGTRGRRSHEPPRARAASLRVGSPRNTPVHAAPDNLPVPPAARAPLGGACPRARARTYPAALSTFAAAPRELRCARGQQLFHPARHHGRRRAGPSDGHLEQPGQDSEPRRRDDQHDEPRHLLGGSSRLPRRLRPEAALRRVQRPLDLHGLRQLKFSSASSAVLIAVSATSNPTGAWYQYLVDADPANVLWADYPSLGFNKDWIVVQVNVFPISSGTFESHVYVFGKADLYANDPHAQPHTLHAHQHGRHPGTGGDARQLARRRVPAAELERQLRRQRVSPDLQHHRLGGVGVLEHRQRVELHRYGEPVGHRASGAGRLRPPAGDDEQDPEQRRPHAEGDLPQRLSLGRAHGLSARRRFADAERHPVVGARADHHLAAADRHHHATCPHRRRHRCALLRLPLDRRQPVRRRLDRLLALLGEPVRERELLLPQLRGCAEHAPRRHRPEGRRGQLLQGLRHRREPLGRLQPHPGRSARRHQLLDHPGVRGDQLRLRPLGHLVGPGRTRADADANAPTATPTARLSCTPPSDPRVATPTPITAGGLKCKRRGSPRKARSS